VEVHTAANVFENVDSPLLGGFDVVVFTFDLPR